MSNNYYKERLALEAIKPIVDFFYNRYTDGSLSKQSSEEEIVSYLFLTHSLMIDIRTQVYIGLDLNFPVKQKNDLRGKGNAE